jgi:hypothetical protein
MGDLVGLWTGCIAGALAVREYERMMLDTGHEQVSIETTSALSQADLQGPG